MGTWRQVLAVVLPVVFGAALWLLIRARLPKELEARLQEVDQYPSIGKYDRLQTTITLVVILVMAGSLLLRNAVGSKGVFGALAPILFTLLGLFGMLVVERRRRREIRRLQQSGGGDNPTA